MKQDDRQYTRDDMRQVFQDWKFGIFVTWGLSAGQGDNHSLSQHELEQRVDEFYAITAQFDASRWVEAFKGAGARYFTVTNRHSADHRFCLFPTDKTKWCSKRDYIGEIDTACREQGLPLFFYYSMTDWALTGRTDFSALTADGDYRAWVKQGHRNMASWLAECVRRYQPTGFWLDGWCGLKGQLDAKGFRPLDAVDYAALTEPARSLKPGVLIGNKADVIHLKDLDPYVDFHSTEYLFQTHFGERLYGDEMVTEVNETLPASVHWFCSFDRQYPGRYPAKQAFKPEPLFLTEAEVQEQTYCFIKRLICTAGRGINYLLNVGPLPNGELMTTDAKILEGIGLWLRQNGDSIYGTRLGPYKKVNRTRVSKDGEPWGYNLAKDNKIYLHIIDNRDITKAYTLGNRGGIHSPAMREIWETSGMPENKQITLEGRPQRIRDVHLLNDTQPIPFDVDGGRVCIDLSRVKADPIDTIVVLELG